ncbi:AraC family transcriptional regulator [Sphaerisporangium melleum]|uniref:AraC family transcriptional regulator n=1 Tax=Sphaerisporangium melleum TaxID=321316 RepID=A0A917VD42_9ACTN|nr:helix-turn-helix domain-containing protein [Sphaerisporangium melleum]GGK64310.1 AraC family transcriptional regulator [Sphaerisporangium melleum]GII70104.1 AraC family transcriptional regulator [Sphaerisporangium melleum]
MPIQEGFRDQRLTVVPRRVVAEAQARPVTRRLTVTDCGYYPSAADHMMTRPNGTEETILILCAAGAGWARVAGAQHRVGPNAALVIPRGAPHSYGASPEAPWTIWWCHLRGSDLPELVEEIGASASRPVLPVRRIDRAIALLDEIVTILERDHSPAALMGAAGAAWKLLTQIVVDRAMPAPGDPLQRAMAYLAERLDSTVRVADLAAMVGVSPSHLSALFRRATGGGVLAHQTALRMAQARNLLDTTDATVAAIAREVGYHDPFYFSRHFKRMHEASPTEYRNRAKG